MQVIPVIDVKGGAVVHARGGDRGKYVPIATKLAPGSSAPEAVVEGLLGLYPFEALYVADLDAIAGEGNASDAIAALRQCFPGLSLWVDNGIGTLASARDWLARDLGMLVLGSESQADPSVARELAGDPRAVLSLDYRGERLVGPAVLGSDPALWPARLIVMTLGRVGSDAGPDHERVARWVPRAHGHAVYAAGGVRSVTDLAVLQRAGAAGALVATALHVGAVSAADLRRIARPDWSGDPD